MSEQNISLSLKNIQFGDQNEYVHDLGCYLSQISDTEERFIDLILFSDESNKATLSLKNSSIQRLKLIFKRLSTNEQVGSISFSYLQLSQISDQIQQFYQWFTLFDNQDDDEFDGVLGESDDQESPRIQLQFLLGEQNNGTRDLRSSQQEQSSILIEKIRETDEEHQENYHSLQLQKIKKQSSCEQNFQKRVESGLKRVEDSQKEFLICEILNQEKIEQSQQVLYQSIKNVSQNLYEQFTRQSSSQPQSADLLQNETNDLNLSDEDSNNFSSNPKIEPVQLTLTSQEYQDKILQLQVILINQEKELENLQQQYEKSITGYQKYFQDLNDENIQLKNRFIDQEANFSKQIKDLERNNKDLEKQFKYMRTVLERRDKILETEQDEKKYILSIVDQINQIVNTISIEENIQLEDTNSKSIKQQSIFQEQLSRVLILLERQSQKEESTRQQIEKLDEELQKSNELLSEALNNKVENQKINQQISQKLEQLNKLQLVQQDEIKDLHQSIKEQQHQLLQEQIIKLQLETELKEQKERIKIQEEQNNNERSRLLKEIELLKKQVSDSTILASYKARLEEKDQVHEQLLKEIEKLQQLMKSSISEYESISQSDIKQYTNQLEVQMEQMNNIISEKDKKINELLYQNQDLCLQMAQYSGQKEFIESLINEIELQKNHFTQLEQHKDKLDDKIVLLQKDLIKKNEQNISLVQKLANMQNQLRQALVTQERIVRQAAMMEQQQQNNYDNLFTDGEDQFKENNNFHQDINDLDLILQQEYSSLKLSKLNQGLYQFGNKLLEMQNIKNKIVCRIIDQNNVTGNQQFILLEELIKQERYGNNFFESLKNYNSTNANSCQHLRNPSSNYSSKENGRNMAVFSSREKEQLSSSQNTQRSVTSGIAIKKSPLQISRISSHNSYRANQN